MKMEKKDVWKLTMKKRERLKGVYIRAKMEVNEQFERKMNQDVNGNIKLFWKKVNKTNRGKEESCSRKKEGNGRFRCKGFGRSILKICII